MDVLEFAVLKENTDVFNYVFVFFLSIFKTEKEIDDWAQAGHLGHNFVQKASW